MGYTTEFKGSFDLDFSNSTAEKANDTIKLVNGLNNTRRVKRDLSKIQDTLDKPYQEYGIDGEFYIDGRGFMGQDKDPSVVDGNNPPSTQPGLWQQWIIEQEDASTFVLQWDEGEKFYNYTEWLKYLIEKIFKPNNVKISGTVEFRGEDWTDIGTITIKDYEVIHMYSN